MSPRMPYLIQEKIKIDKIYLTNYAKRNILRNKIT